MSSPSEPGPGEKKPERAIHFFPRSVWENGRALVNNEETAGSIAESDDDVFHSLPSDTEDNDSIRSFLSVLDKTHHIPESFPDNSSANMRNSFAPERHSTISPPAATGKSPKFPSPKVSRQSGFSKAFQTRIARGRDLGFTMPTEMERCFHRNSRLAHRIQSEGEKRFHHYIDHLEAEQLRRRRPSYDSDEESQKADSFMENAAQQPNLEEERAFLTVPSPAPVPSPTSTVSEPYMPFNNTLALQRCHPLRLAATQKSISPMNLTPQRALHSSPRSIWPSPSPVRVSDIRYTAGWYVAVTAASESGEVWEDVDAVWVGRDRGPERDDGDGEGSTFTAQEEDLEDEVEGISGGLKGESKRKRGWKKCKKVLKRVLGWKK